MQSLKRKLPPNRNLEQVYHHYKVEKTLACQLLKASREQRGQIYLTMYHTLFREVPDHPRLTSRADRGRTNFANDSKLSFLRRHLGPQRTVLEFAPGDCKFALELCKHVRKVYAVDISDQREGRGGEPENFRLIIYNGYHLDIPENSVDVVFSDHLVEHFHPEDTRLHFQLALSLLVPRGAYLFRTPHAFSGPHDISTFFCDWPEGFHLKEWTYGELSDLLKKLGFRHLRGYRALRNFRLRLPLAFFRLMENLLRHVPARQKRILSHWVFRTINVVAVK